MAVESIEQSGLRWFVSQNPHTFPVGSVREEALIFYRVLDEIFQQTAIIPFRFPTIFSSEQEALAHFADHAEEYSSALIRLRNVVQMEIRISFRVPSSARSDSQTKPTGAEYLRNLHSRNAALEAAANQLRDSNATFTKGWRQTGSAESIRCFVLIDRSIIDKFRIELQAVTIQPELIARLSGPWPASQFLKES
jgi:hypothetical protein